MSTRSPHPNTATRKRFPNVTTWVGRCLVHCKNKIEKEKEKEKETRCNGN